MNEIWVDVKGYEGLYKVSNTGKIKSFGKGKQEKELSQKRFSKDGYLRVSLQKNGKPKEKGIHRVVAENFIENPCNKDTVNHIDGVKTNNCVSNLEWATKEENMKHAYDNGLKKPIRGCESANSKLTPENVTQIKNEYIVQSSEFGGVALSKKYNVSKAAIYRIINNKTYKL